MKPDCVLWCITDDRAGHINQIHGLSTALAARLTINTHTLRPPSLAGSLLHWLSRRFPAGAGLPDPSLIICAGHTTLLAALAARRARGGRVIVLMKPSLPLNWFDLCIIPEHDGTGPRSNVVLTRGVLNAITPADHLSEDHGLILIGGPSKGYLWSDQNVVDQVQEIMQRTSARHWTLTTSRRTPESFLPKIEAVQSERLTVVPGGQTTPDWVPERLATASQVWVTEDSVSMVYEALTAGAAVGLLELPRRTAGRVAAGWARLIEEGWITPFPQWRAEGVLQPPPHQLHEAARCAELICQRFFGAG